MGVSDHRAAVACGEMPGAGGGARTRQAPSLLPVFAEVARTQYFDLGKQDGGGGPLRLLAWPSISLELQVPPQKGSKSGESALSTTCVVRARHGHHARGGQGEAVLREETYVLYTSSSCAVTPGAQGVVDMTHVCEESLTAPSCVDSADELAGMCTAGCGSSNTERALRGRPPQKQQGVEKDRRTCCRANRAHSSSLTVHTDLIVLRLSTVLCSVSSRQR